MFTAPTFNRFLIVPTGRVFARCRVVTRMIGTADAVLLSLDDARARKRERKGFGGGGAILITAPGGCTMNLRLPVASGEWANYHRRPLACRFPV